MKKTGDFAGAIARIKRQIVTNKVAKIGVLENQTYDDKKNTPVAYVATIHEYGSPEQNIPPRSFFRPTVSIKREEWANIIKQLLKNGASVEGALELVGQRAAADIVETISNIHSPPLAPETIRRRNAKYTSESNEVSVKPLVDSGLLIASISSVVEDSES